MTITNSGSALAVPIVTDEQRDLITRTIAKDATADELRLYLYDCARQGVHPLDKLIHFTKRAGRYIPITSIDFMRIRAADTGEYIGCDDAIFTGDPKKPGFAATVTVWRLVQGQRCPFVATARWEEYKPEQNDFMWQKMPHGQLGKCAEALAFRKGFPRQLAGLYAKEEMDQAERVPILTVTAPTVDTDTGEIAERAEPPDGAVYIERVTNNSTRNKNVTRWTVVFSDHVEAATIKRQLGALAEQLAQEGVPVMRETADGKFGVELVSLTRWRVKAPSAPAPPAAELTADDIPF